MDRLLKDLLAHQKRIFATMDRAEPILSSPSPDTNQLEFCRGQVSAALTTYQLFKHRELFPALNSIESLEARRRVSDLQAECILLGNDFRAHASQWRCQDVCAYWSEYSKRALDLIGRVRTQLANEADEAQRLGSGNVAPSPSDH